MISTMPDPAKPSAKVLEALGLAEAKLTLFKSGLINNSWRADTSDGNTVVVQRVNPIFPVAINNDINIVTKHLENKGILTPRILPTVGKKLVLVTSGELWRLMTFIPGITRDILENPRQANEAGALLARFHLALSDLEHTFENARLGVHNTPLHLETLKNALEDHKTHARFNEINPIGELILDMASTLPELPASTDRIVHGDPKISNIVFDEVTDNATCLIDLDTIASMPIIFEMGDAFRSWCNPYGEENKEATFSLPLFHSAVIGYMQEARNFLTVEEWRALPGATLTIAIELAARFTADALMERHFSWDSERYRDASEHNQVRAQSQISLAHSIREQWTTLEDVIRAAIDS